MAATLGFSPQDKNAQRLRELQPYQRLPDSTTGSTLGSTAQHVTGSMQHQGPNTGSGLGSTAQHVASGMQLQGPGTGSLAQTSQSLGGGMQSLGTASSAQQAQVDAQRRMIESGQGPQTYDATLSQYGQNAGMQTQGPGTGGAGGISDQMKAALGNYNHSAAFMRPGYDGNDTGDMSGAQPGRQTQASAGPGSGQTGQQQQQQATPSQGFLDAYSNGTAVGKNWDGEKWVEAKGQPDLAQDADGSLWYKGQKLSPQEAAQLQLQGPGFMNAGNPMSQQIKNLGFGAAPTQYTAPTIADFEHAQGYTPQAGTVGPGQQAVGATAQGVSAQGYGATAGKASYDPNMIKAAQVTAEQGGFKDFDKLQQAIYHSIFDPQQNELDRQLGNQSQALKAQLAQSGLADSGVGADEVRKLHDEIGRQAMQASSQAANQAAVQRYGMEYTQSMDNAHMRQEANLANANLTMQAQTENARNFLTMSVTNAQLQTQASIASAQNRTNASIASAANQTQANIASAQNQTQASLANAANANARAIAQAQLTTQANIAGAANRTQAGITNAQLSSAQNIAQAQAQLAAMGLNQQSEHQARQDFLGLLGIQEQDLARMDAFDMDNLSLFYNTYLKQLAIIVNAGTSSSGKGDSSSSESGGKVTIE